MRILPRGVDRVGGSAAASNCKHLTTCTICDSDSSGQILEAIELLEAHTLKHRIGISPR